MNMLKHVAAFAVAAALLSAACSKQKSSGAKLKDDLDSAAYVVGLNVGMNLLEMDSTLRIDAVCDGIRDVFARVEKMSPAEAKAFYLRWINYEQPEKIRRYEERFLEDIRQSNRSFARTPSGVTYTVEEIGGEAYEGETLWFNLQGQRVDNPGRGVYIRVRGAKAEKVLVD